MNSTDYLRPYTAPRALLIGVLFLLAVAFRIPAVTLALGVHVLDRTADRLTAFLERIPPGPVRTGPTTRRRRYR